MGQYQTPTVQPLGGGTSTPESTGTYIVAAEPTISLVFTVVWDLNLD